MLLERFFHSPDDAAAPVWRDLTRRDGGARGAGARGAGTVAAADRIIIPLCDRLLRVAACLLSGLGRLLILTVLIPLRAWEGEEEGGRARFRCGGGVPEGRGVGGGGIYIDEDGDDHW